MIYSLTGRINTETAPAVDKQIEEAIKQSKTPVDRLTLDCGVPTAISFDIVDCGAGRHGAIYDRL